MHAIGGYLQNFEHQLLGFLVDFKEANSMSEAYCMALIEAIQCAIEEFECIETNLYISSNEVDKLVNQRRLNKLGMLVCYDKA